MNQAGVGQYQANGGTAWVVISDETKKNIIEPITDGLAKVSSLRSVIYSLKSDEKNTRRVGLIAQEVQKVLPEAVDEVDDTLGLAYTDVIPLLVAALKEANERITALENK
jgi:trans-2-enoyl-CoA reductase